ncbi:unnamed protein product [Psylliodes chrysocephalus]|uniref:Uncharacterized protein n=1 Tax=Psylliodes chrysocephalus TaxID=3402493 RepID=A0A9P0CKH6_9CUCU|nr:unnamed protein product [Psylliodes chrysocephala]
MQNRILVQSIFIFLIAIYLTLETDASTRSIGKVKRATANNSSTATKPTRTTPKPGFFRTLFSVVYDQYQDTRNTIGTVNKLVNDNFLPENGKPQSATPAPGTNATTTEDNRITRTEFNKIILRNLRGLQRLFQIELRDALKQSEKNYDEFRRNVSTEIGKFL